MKNNIHKITQFLFVAIILLLTFSCKLKNKFDREEYVFRYLREVAKVDISKKNDFILFVVNNNVCSCSGDLNEIITMNFLQNTRTKYLVVGKNDSISENLKSKLKNVTVFVDENENLSKYGLNNATHYLFDFKNKEIVYWNTINNATAKEIKEKYNKTIP